MEIIWELFNLNQLPRIQIILMQPLHLEQIWEFGYIAICRTVSMLRLDYTNSDIGELSEKMDNEFETIESIIKDALEIVDEYEKQIESSKLNKQKILEFFSQEFKKTEFKYGQLDITWNQMKAKHGTEFGQNLGMNIKTIPVFEQV